jgi:sugar phosphate isomerase/epimerase
MMRLKEVSELIGDINLAFPRFKPIVPDPDGRVLSMWMEDVGEFSYAEVQEAFRIYRGTGTEFPPSSGQLRAEVAEARNPLPRFDEALTLIEKSISKFGTYRTEEAMAYLGQTPAVVELVDAMGGYGVICHGGPLHQDQAVEGGTWRAQQERAWKEIIRSIKEERAKYALVAPPRKALPPSSSGGLNP